MPQKDMRATDSSIGNLKYIEDIWLEIPNAAGQMTKLQFRSLPEISDSKSANYSQTPIAGRSAPIITYAGSGPRSISLTFHLYVTREEDIVENMMIIRSIASLVHPKYEGTYLPPRIARLKMAKMLSVDPLPVVLLDYRVNYEQNVQWFWSEKQETYMPLHVALSTSMQVVYSWTTLPGQQAVLEGKY